MAEAPRSKRQTAFRLTDDALDLLRMIGDSMGVNMTAALEIIIREAAKARGIVVTPQRKTESD